MQYNKACKILKENGVHYSNYFDLDYILNNTKSWQGKEQILIAITRVKEFIIYGK